VTSWRRQTFGIYHFLMSDRSGIFITGGAGFIGSHLVNTLAKGKNLTLIDNLRSGDWGRITSNVNKVQTSLNEISDSELSAFLRDCDTLIHFAAEKHNSSHSQSDLLFQTNIISSERLFRLAGLAGVRKIIFSSSLYVYDHTSQGPFKEGLNEKPRTLYGISKFASELILEKIAREYGMTWHAPRFFFVYGPAQYAEGGYKSVIVKNFQRAKQGLPLTVFGSGHQKMDYIFVDDVIKIIEKLLHFETSTGIFNLSTGVPQEILALITHIAEITGNSDVSYLPADWTEGITRVGNNSKLMTFFPDFEFTALENGLLKTWEYYK
jgi:UDP-glucose 4-epimerase